MANIRKRGNTYQIRVSCGYKLNGEQVVQTMSWKPPEGMTPKQAEKEVQKQAILFEEKCLRGQVTANVKFEEFAEQWFEEYARLNLRKSSFERMRQVTQRVYPAFGHLRLDRITGRQIQQFINELVLNGKNMQTGKPLSRKTAVHHLSFISDVFSYAVRMDIVSDNPCRKVYVPKGGKKEKEIYSIEEIEQLFTLLEDAPLKYRTFFTLAVYTGFRRGELMGLEWKDIDFESGVVSVRRTSNYTVKTGIYTDTTKTKSSQRSMKLPQLVLDILKEHKTEQDNERQKLGTKWFECDRLFVTADGHPMHNNTTYNWLRKFCKKNDFPFRDIHSLRHFYASALINEGIDVATVSSALGHSAISTTIPVPNSNTIPVAVHTDKSTKTVIYKSTAFRDQLGRRCYLLLMPISLIRFITILCYVSKHCLRILTSHLNCDILYM
ncbi:site-specific integrase [Ruminococcus sp. NK3A76]|uniref:tyrosine-type recombinase/integrase n=1 Tax=Ruminococcus sp. NK3A76 TaxID=877411 RepID=UPI000A011B35|nr:site-specific integrase [Ruminococcus sp. NK3A76]